MKLYHIHLQELRDIAVIAAKEAGEYISAQRSVHHNRIEKKGGNTEASQIVTNIDFRSQEIILSHVLPTCEPFNLGLLTEEDIQDKVQNEKYKNSRLNKEYFWCIDPLDGTLPFVEGNPGYAVSIAIVSKSGEAVLGIIYDPVKGVLYEAIKGLGCLRNGKKWKLKKPKNNGDFLFTSNRSFKQLPSYDTMRKNVVELAISLGCKQVVERQHGGAVMNAIWVLENTPSCYVALPKKQDGGGSIWDFAATACIFDEMGLSPVNCQKTPLNLNSEGTTFMNKQGVIYASDSHLQIRILELVKNLN